MARFADEKVWIDAVVAIGVVGKIEEYWCLNECLMIFWSRMTLQGVYRLSVNGSLKPNQSMTLDVITQKCGKLLFVMIGFTQGPITTPEPRKQYSPLRCLSLSLHVGLPLFLLFSGYPSVPVTTSTPRGSCVRVIFPFDLASALLSPTRIVSISFLRQPSFYIDIPRSPVVFLGNCILPSSLNCLPVPWLAPSLHCYFLPSHIFANISIRLIGFGNCRCFLI